MSDRLLSAVHLSATGVTDSKAFLKVTFSPFKELKLWKSTRKKCDARFSPDNDNTQTKSNQKSWLHFTQDHMANRKKLQ